MKTDINKLYDDNFYEKHTEGMGESAKIILGLLYNYYKPLSVIDIGCGQGAWLAAAELLGAKTLKGFDGKWIRTECLQSENIEFTAVNFDKSMPKVSEKYDLCIPLEVAEHISKANAEKFIGLLCQSSDTILFSAAIKQQGGTGHINEQWQSYWIDLFKSHNYECVDLIREKLWNNKSVEYWYRQNTFLFLGPNNKVLNLKLLKSEEKPIYDIVHPMKYKHKIFQLTQIIEKPTIRFCLSCFNRYVQNLLRELLT